MSADSPMRHASSRTIRSPTSYGWLDVKRFEVDIQRPVEATLTELFKQAAYADLYLTDKSDVPASGHGPYRLDALGASAYAKASVEAALAVLEEEALAVGAGDLRGAIRVAVEEAGGGRADWYHLTAIDDSAKHDAAWALDGFAEVVGLDGPQGMVTLMAVGAD